jgi:transcriptional regulator with XRE-family HTH domain
VYAPIAKKAAWPSETWPAYHNTCDKLAHVKDLRSARLARGSTQAQAAARLGVSQSYLAMLEAGKRRLTPELARRAVRAFGLAPTALAPHHADTATRRTAAPALAADLAALGYPGFAHLTPRRWVPKNPARVLLDTVERDDLEARVVEALPWLVLKYWPLDQVWLVREAKLRDLQNRLGFVVTLARSFAERTGDGDKAAALAHLEAQLERSRLAREEPLCRASLPDAERRWLVEHRSADARRWNLLTDWTVDALRYAG